MNREQLDAVINIRLTSDEKERIKREADAAGLTISQFGRRRLLGRKVVAKADDVMIKELRRLGGLLKHIHNESGGAYSRDTAEALHAVKSFIEKLSRS